MSEMVERVAKAILDHVPQGYGMYQNEAEEYARAAIAAMREPTGEMKDAGADSYGVPAPAIGSLPLSVINGQPTKAWQAMIDEALKG